MMTVFISTQNIEVARMTKKPFRIAFLDINGAYDNESQEKLCVQLREYDLDAHLFRLLQHVYTNNKVVITWKAEITESAEIKKRPQAGLSPITSLFFL